MKIEATVSARDEGGVRASYVIPSVVALHLDADGLRVHQAGGQAHQWPLSVVLNVTARGA